MIKYPCNKICIGETSRSLKHCAMEHRSAIKRNDPTSSGARRSNASNHPATSSAFLGTEAVKPNQRGGSLDFIQKKNQRRILDFFTFFPPPEGWIKIFHLTTFYHLHIYHLPLGPFFEQNITASVKRSSLLWQNSLVHGYSPLFNRSMDCMCVWLTVWFVLWLVLCFYIFF